MMTTVLQGLPAQTRGDCRVLVLGSMPGMASLDAAQYYAHPRNRFWPLLGVLCGFSPSPEYAHRLRQAQDAGVGLWDVIGQCRRRGSLDSAIERGSEVPNALAELMSGLPGLRGVACNGASAAQAYARWIAPGLPTALGALPVLALPSTSPANAAMTLPRLVQAWSPLQGWLASSAQLRP